MAKKKKVEVDEDDDFGDLDDGDFELAIPSTTKKKEEPASVPSDNIDDMDDEGVDDLDLGFTEEVEVRDYKHIKPIINKAEGEYDYELMLEGQSHGFCNIFVKHLLEIDGVNVAAYKVTRLKPAQILIRLEKGFKIKDIIRKGIESLRDEVVDVQKLFQSLA